MATGNIPVIKVLVSIAAITTTLALSTFAVAAADAWSDYADCAAAYRANWQDRLTDPSRKPEMRDMIRQQSDDYRAAAVRRYRQDTGASQLHAEEAVKAYIAKHLARFVSMDNRDELNDFLDKCPQPDEAGPL